MANLFFRDDAFPGRHRALSIQHGINKTIRLLDWESPQVKCIIATHHFRTMATQAKLSVHFTALLDAFRRKTGRLVSRGRSCCVLTVSDGGNQYNRDKQVKQRRKQRRK